jgi:serine/threonine protein kinase
MSKGGTLEIYAETDQLLPFTKVAEIMYKCCKALEYAQTQGVIHRDIKPANILLQGETDVKISDFGAAMIEDGDNTLVSGVGSLTYMSPEQITGEMLTQQTDIYSLGVTMSKLLTGKLPFKATSRHGMMYEKVNGEQPPPKTYRPQIPDELDAIVQRATRRELSQRYQTWGDFAHDLASFLNLNNVQGNARFDAEKFDALRSTPFFDQFSENELLEVLHFSKWHKVSRGTSILKEGDAGNAFFILTTGITKVLKGGKIVSFLHKGDCFGEIKRLPGSAYLRTTGVEAGTDCVLFEVDLDVLAKASLACRFQFDEAFLHLLLKRLDLANTRISKLLGQEADFGTPVKVTASRSRTDIKELN